MDGTTKPHESRLKFFIHIHALLAFRYNLAIRISALETTYTADLNISKWKN